MRINSAKVFTALTLLLFLELAASEKLVECKRIARTSIYSPRTCQVQPSAVIDAEDFQIKSLANVEVLNFCSSWNISFLPIKLNKILPNLNKINCTSCFVKMIYEKNFEGLGNLVQLLLSGNKIKAIPANAFKDLGKLGDLDLSE